MFVPKPDFSILFKESNENPISYLEFAFTDSGIELINYEFRFNKHLDVQGNSPIYNPINNSISYAIIDEENDKIVFEEHTFWEYFELCILLNIITVTKLIDNLLLNSNKSEQEVTAYLRVIISRINYIKKQYQKIEAIEYIDCKDKLLSNFILKLHSKYSYYIGELGNPPIANINHNIDNVSLKLSKMRGKKTKKVPKVLKLIQWTEDINEKQKKELFRLLQESNKFFGDNTTFDQFNDLFNGTCESKIIWKPRNPKNENEISKNILYYLLEELKINNIIQSFDDESVELIFSDIDKPLANYKQTRNAFKKCKKNNKLFNKVDEIIELIVKYIKP